jgi:hypothetical protein
VLKRRTTLFAAAGICWGISAAVLVGSLLSESIAEGNLYGRICFISGMVAAVISSRIWNDRRVVHIPLPTEMVYGNGFKMGMLVQKMKCSGHEDVDRPFTSHWAGEVTKYARRSSSGHRGH